MNDLIPVKIAAIRKDELYTAIMPDGTRFNSTRIRVDVYQDELFPPEFVFSQKKDDKWEDVLMVMHKRINDVDIYENQLSESN